MKRLFEAETNETSVLSLNYSQLQRQMMNENFDKKEINKLFQSSFRSMLYPINLREFLLRIGNNLNRNKAIFYALGFLCLQRETSFNNFEDRSKSIMKYIITFREMNKNNKMSVPLSAIEILNRMPLTVSDNFFNHKFVRLTYQKTDIPFFKLKRKYNKTKVMESYRENTSEL